uniref:iron chelate uptake ABC transporter family permease subunit n=1 Tax=Pseudomonas sp. TaxID=306 RepID=UPI00272AFCFC
MIVTRHYHSLAMLALGALLLAAILASLALGAVPIHPADTLRALAAILGWGEVAAETRLIIEHIRLPRTLMGLLVGATLALTGAVMQGLFRNPLAD